MIAAHLTKLIAGCVGVSDLKGRYSVELSDGSTRDATLEEVAAAQAAQDAEDDQRALDAVEVPAAKIELRDLLAVMQAVSDAQDASITAMQAIIDAAAAAQADMDVVIAGYDAANATQRAGMVKDLARAMKRRTADTRDAAQALKAKSQEAKDIARAIRRTIRVVT